MDEQEFKNHAEQALDDLYRRLCATAEDYDFEADFNAGALAIEFSAGGFSALLASPARGAFVLPGTGQSLAELIGDAIVKQLGEKVAL